MCMNTVGHLKKRIENGEMKIVGEEESEKGRMESDCMLLC